MRYIPIGRRELSWESSLASQIYYVDIAYLMGLKRLDIVFPEFSSFLLLLKPPSLKPPLSGFRLTSRELWFQKDYHRNLFEGKASQ